MKINQISSITPGIFLNECKRALYFLTTEYEFSKPEVANTNNLFNVTYYNKHLAIECSYDVRDDMDSVYVTKLSNSKKPNCYRVNKSNEVVSEHLTTLLMGRRPENLKFKIELNKNIPKVQAELRKSLLISAFLLRTYGNDILNDSTEIFNNLYPEDGDKF